VRFGRSKKDKVLFMLGLLLAVGLTGAGCVGIKSAPEGGSGVAIAGDILYVAPAFRTGGGGLSCAPQPSVGKLISVNTSGAQQWEVPLEPSARAGGGFSCAPASVPVAIYGTPVVDGGLVYVGGYNGIVYALNSDSGALRWVYPRQGSLQPIIGGLVVAGDKVFFGNSDGKVYALDAETGDKKWEFATEDKLWSTPFVEGDTLYIGSFDKRLYALNTADGSEKWAFETDGAITSTPIIYNDTVYLGSFDRYLYAVRAADGSLKWKFMGGNWFWASPVVSGNNIYAGCLDGKVYTLDVESGSKVAEINLESPISSSPAVVDGSVIVATEAGKVYAIENNQRRELRTLGAKVLAPLYTSNGVVYVHAENDKLYALNVQTGAELWALSLSGK